MTELAALNMDWRVAGPMVGDASSIKMLRSVMIKGFEALCAECLLAARRAGVEDAVLASLQASDPGWVWHERGAYNLERMMVHGARRAAEMREVAATLRDLGLSDRMAAATAQWQHQIAALHLPGGPDDLADRADRILSKLP
jgi:3-hydroxyisobutyrate dehydrogenase-like beta-hydroxyacid dehydrogenase